MRHLIILHCHQQWWQRFFFCRCAHPQRSLRMLGGLRIFYGLLLLYDRLLLGLDRHFLFGGRYDDHSSSHDALIPCQQFFHDLHSGIAEDGTPPHIDISYPRSLWCTLLETPFFDTSAPLSLLLVDAFYYLGLFHIGLLILGVAPRLQLLCLQVHLLAFHFYTPLIWDGEDVMVRLWNVLFLTLPLQHVTIYDGWKWLFPKPTKEKKEYIEEKEKETVVRPLHMWPFRLWQVQVGGIYAGAGYAKLATPVWRSGNALYHIIHEKDFFGGPWVPQVLFGHYGPLKLLTWASLLLECTGFILVWYRPWRPYIVAAMVLLHVGIDLTMNMHMFEWLSILGWLMFLFEAEEEEVPKKPKETIKEDTTTTNTTSAITTKKPHSYDDMSPRRRLGISVVLVIAITIIVVDTFPLMELYDCFLPFFYRVGDASLPTTGVAVSALNALYYLHRWRTRYFTIPIAVPYLYPLGLYQDVWNLYSGAPDTFCQYEIIMTPSISSSAATAITGGGNEEISIFQSPDWGPMTWWEKKRWQRLMTMYEKLPDMMCRDCFVQYHARRYIEAHDASAITAVASLRLQMQCESPPPPPEHDDWFNWTGWFYAPAKQDPLVPHALRVLHVLNLCDDLRPDQCAQWHAAGLCDLATTTTHTNVFAMTHWCRRSCRLCPEHGYDADHLALGTRLAVIWPLPAVKRIRWPEEEIADEDAPMYYEATIVEIKERPPGQKRYLLQYDDDSYLSDWFDPILLRERGYRLLPSQPEEEEEKFTLAAGSDASELSPSLPKYPDGGDDEL